VRILYTSEDAFETDVIAKLHEVFEVMMLTCEKKMEQAKETNDTKWLMILLASKNILFHVSHMHLE